MKVVDNEKLVSIGAKIYGKSYDDFKANLQKSIRKMPRHSKQNKRKLQILSKI